MTGLAWLAARVSEKTIAPKAARERFRTALERWAVAKTPRARKAAAQEALSVLALMSAKSRRLAKAAVPSGGDAPGDVLRLATAIGGGPSNDAAERRTR